jgi:transcriptional regulator GlxA family with amidase domain
MRLPAFVSASLIFGGSIFKRSHCSFDLEMIDSSILSVDSLNDLLHSRPLWEVLSLLVFMNPQEGWSVENIANSLRTTSSRVRRTLFSQGNCFTEICSTQRLMRALFELTSGKGRCYNIANRIGWHQSSDFESCFYNRFNVSADAILKMRFGGH